MPKKARAKKQLDRLPNAPLAEVVFEMRWKLQGNAPFLTDPGILPLTAAFTPRAAKLGFSTFKDMARAEEVIGHQVTRRYFTAPDVSFPLVQIGPGVFASNQSAEYSWPAFKSQTLRALKIFFDSYPKLKGFPFEPIHMELRYIDVFDDSLLGTLDLLEFANRGTAMAINIPDSLFDKKLFTGSFDGRLLIQKELKNGSNFLIDFASGLRAPAERILRLESKVIAQANVPKFRGASKFMPVAEKWLSDAHDVTSPFFKSFLTSEVMDKFS